MLVMIGLSLNHNVPTSYYSVPINLNGLFTTQHKSTLCRQVLFCCGGLALAARSDSEGKYFLATS